MIYAGDAGLFKVCSKCLVVKPTSDFYKSPASSHGVTSSCKMCIKIYYLNNRDDIIERQKNYYIDNRDSILRYAKEVAGPRRSGVRRKSARDKLDHAVSNGIRQSLASGTKSGRKWESITGYSIDDLMCHLERHFLIGMRWDNYGHKGWHIDHVIPKSAFNYTDSDHIDFKKCWSLSNLRPLWWRDNLAKGARLEKPFQPSLPI